MEEKGNSVLKKSRTHCRLTIGKNCIIQDDVIIGNSDNDEVIIGDNALIRSGTIIYSNVKIGNGFKTGHRAFIRENSEIGDNVLIGQPTKERLQRSDAPGVGLGAAPLDRALPYHLRT